MSSEKLTPNNRRRLVLRGLAGESVLALSREYGVTRSWIYALLEEARQDAGDKLLEAKAEYLFRQKVSKKLLEL